ncbi:MAG: hypothetical protein H7834_16845, partial [Magnetococcus sp. YQC-9]
MGHVRGIVLQKTQNNPASLGGARRIFAKGARNASFKERAKVKVKTLGEESPVVPYVNLNRTHFGMRSFSQGCVQDAGVVSKKRKRPPPRRRAAHFSQKTRKMLLLKSALKAKS